MHDDLNLAVIGNTYCEFVCDEDGGVSEKENPMAWPPLLRCQDAAPTTYFDGGA